ncbi:MAG: hypothetical protein HC843_11095 [Sphingomonadales bacterium]|nr:hypothetical protein [Sphingomonadales bacterium]
MILGLLSLSTAILSPTPLVIADQVSVVGQQVTLSDIADISALPDLLRQKAKDIVVAKFPGKTAIYQKSALLSRGRSLLPALSPWLKNTGGTIMVSQKQSSSGRIIAYIDSIKKGDSPIAKGQMVTVHLQWRDMRVSSRSKPCRRQSLAKRFSLGLLIMRF